MVYLKFISIILSLLGLLTLVIYLVVSSVKKAKIDFKLFGMGVVLSVLFLIIGVVVQFFNHQENTTAASQKHSQDSTGIQKKTNAQNSGVTAERDSKEDQQLFLSNLQPQLAGITNVVEQQIKTYQVYVLINGLTSVKQQDIDSTSSNLQNLNDRLNTMRSMDDPQDTQLKNQFIHILLSAENLYNSLQKAQTPLMNNYSKMLTSIVNEDIKGATNDYNQAIAAIGLTPVDDITVHSFDENKNKNIQTTATNNDVPDELLEDLNQINDSAKEVINTFSGSIQVGEYATDGQATVNRDLQMISDYIENMVDSSWSDSETAQTAIKMSENLYDALQDAADKMTNDFSNQDQTSPRNLRENQGVLQDFINTLK